MKKFIPAWKDKEGNRLVFMAKDHVFDTWREAFEHSLEVFLLLVPYGLAPDGVYEVDLDENLKGSFEHVKVDTPLGCRAAIIAGPVFDEVTARADIEAGHADAAGEPEGKLDEDENDA
jgi:hypothetical protein